ncbi:arsenate reductase (glutaredoxin) [Leeia oryzae]|uniref:arsenate reductase (glutaredoxin) n=1 Tax=Leeia oryzae TaxID=356662 RepID=UPI0003828618|nr:arsenate reductase (glutaredoxin) [Leeia oryzae]
MSFKIYHNARCSKSREVYDLLLATGEEIVVQHYLETPPTRAELEQLLIMLGLTDPRDMMRKKEPEYIELNLASPALDHAALLDAMVQYPRLIERPIVVHGNEAKIGRPPEVIADWLGITPA